MKCYSQVNNVLYAGIQIRYSVNQVSTRWAHPLNTLHNIMSDSFTTSEDGIRQDRKWVFSRVLVMGLVRLIENQRAFAGQLGIPLQRVFPTSHHLFAGHTATQLVAALFKNDAEGAEALSLLLNDLAMHQVGIFSALDGVACEAVSQLCDEEASHGVGRLSDTAAWCLLKENIHELVDNPTLRFEKIVVPGFMNSYFSCIARRRKKSAPPRVTSREKDNAVKTL
ncbi:MAG: hypothetical protein HY080_07880 [Gammaproteobacteria bacterium]|nr:hypothetical protein [Gammaproteobacteria bacterium]